jgi:hypothetical protein
MPNMLHIEDYISYLYSHFKCKNEVCTDYCTFMTKGNVSMNKKSPHVKVKF